MDSAILEKIKKEYEEIQSILTLVKNNRYLKGMQPPEDSSILQTYMTIMLEK